MSTQEENNPQFSAGKSGDPRDLARETAESQARFAELQWHQLNSLEVIGCRVNNDSQRPWSPPHGAEGE